MKLTRRDFIQFSAATACLRQWMREQCGAMPASAALIPRKSNGGSPAKVNGFGL